MRPCAVILHYIIIAPYSLFSLRLCHHHRMPNDEPKKSEGKFSEVARKSREKRAAMEQQRRDEDAGSPDLGSNGGTDVKDS